MGSNLQDKSLPTNKFTLGFLQHITNNFSEDRILGRGAGGVVYKGVLDTGEEIALKKLNRIELDDKEFTNEFNNNIFRANHQNIVQFVGYCYHEDRICTEKNGQYVFALEAERILCFEYLHGGDLERHLSDEQPCRLDWQTCYKIIKGVCSGLNYLHSLHIYHLDLKPANILLDNNMMPKIGDFGISRIFPSAKTITTATGTLIGTMGFMPPEYIDKQEISSKYDMFSLGAIIVQIMAGRKNYCDCGSVPSEDFIELVCEIWRKKLHPTMSSHTWQEVYTCIGIALRCLEDDRHKRPTIREIVNELNRIDIKNLSLTDEIADELNRNARIAIENFSLTEQATNLQSRVALAYNHYKNSALIEVHDSSNRFESPAGPKDYEGESIVSFRNPEIRAIGGREDVTRTNDGHRLPNPNIREKGIVHPLVGGDIMDDIAGVPSGISEFVNIFQWARSAISSEWGGTPEERFQDDIFQLQSGLEFLSDQYIERSDLSFSVLVGRTTSFRISIRCYYR